MIQEANILLRSRFNGLPNLRFIEIGCHIGLTTWDMANNILTGEGCTITCIDPWDKWSKVTVNKATGMDHVFNKEAYIKFCETTKDFKDKLIIKMGLSKDVLPTLPDEHYHYIYIDGDHSEDAVWIDAELSFKKLRKNGIMIFDDYMWGNPPDSPKPSVDRFMKEYKDKIKVLTVAYQVIIEKIVS